MQAVEIARAIIANGYSNDELNERQSQALRTVMREGAKLVGQPVDQ